MKWRARGLAPADARRGAEWKRGVDAAEMSAWHGRHRKFDPSLPRSRSCGVNAALQRGRVAVRPKPAGREDFTAPGSASKGRGEDGADPGRGRGTAERNWQRNEGPRNFPEFTRLFLCPPFLHPIPLPDSFLRPGSGAVSIRGMGA